MKFTLARIISPTQSAIKKIDTENNDIEEKIIDIEQLDQEDIHTLFFHKENVNDELIDFLQKENKFYPCLTEEQLNLSSDFFTNLTTSRARDLFLGVYGKWIMVNNIFSIEDIFSITKYFKQLWQEDRHSFFEELWFFLRNNIGTSHLRIIFNDLLVNEEQESAKEKLGHSTILGEKKANIKSAGNPEEKLMESFKDQFHHHFEIQEYSSDAGELTITASVKKSPILIMARVFTLNHLQKALIKAVFTGLNQ
ncbi:MAG: hypothetical protein ACOCUH_03040 [Bacteriovoracia bacterium]